jgi:hypothetical protein
MEIASPLGSRFEEVDEDNCEPPSRLESMKRMLLGILSTKVELAITLGLFHRNTRFAISGAIVFSKHNRLFMWPPIQVELFEN